MALSADEQRALAEIERRLAADDPGLAICLTAFRRPGPATVLRSPRARIVGSLFTVLLVAMVSLMVYAMIPFRAHSTRAPATSTTSAAGTTAISRSAGGDKAKSPPPAPASADSPARRGASPSAGQSASSEHSHPAGSQAGDHASPAVSGP